MSSWQVLNQDETPLLYSLVFGEGVVNDATSVVLFNAIQRFDLSHITSTIATEFFINFFYLFLTSTVLGIVVSHSLSISISLSLFLCQWELFACAFPHIHLGLCSFSWNLSMQIYILSWAFCRVKNWGKNWSCFSTFNSITKLLVLFFLLTFNIFSCL